MKGQRQRMALSRLPALIKMSLDDDILVPTHITINLSITKPNSLQEKLLYCLLYISVYRQLILNIQSRNRMLKKHVLYIMEYSAKGQLPLPLQ
jgi:hypothetical protein